MVITYLGPHECRASREARVGREADSPQHDTITVHLTPRVAFPLVECGLGGNRERPTRNPTCRGERVERVERRERVERVERREFKGREPDRPHVIGSQKRYFPNLPPLPVAPARLVVAQEPQKGDAGGRPGVLFPPLPRPEEAPCLTATCDEYLRWSEGTRRRKKGKKGNKGNEGK